MNFAWGKIILMLWNSVQCINTFILPHNISLHCCDSAANDVNCQTAHWLVVLNYMNPEYFTLAAIGPETVTNAHVSAHFRYSLWASVISTHIRTAGLYVKTTIIYQLKRLCIPDCAYTENMFINSIHISLYDISLTQNILYQIKRDVAVWKILGCPQRNQRTWWQIMATPYKGLA